MGCGASKFNNSASSSGGSLVEHESTPPFVPAGFRVLFGPLSDTNEYEAEGLSLGSGQFGAVHRARHRKTGALVAIKSIEKSAAVAVAKSRGDVGQRATFASASTAALGLQASGLDELRNEIEILDCLAGQPYACGLIDVMESARRVHIVMPFYAGGGLDAYLATMGSQPLSEPAAAVIMRAVLRAVGACHAYGVVHGDPANFLLSRPGDVSSLVLSDFGLSSFYTPGTPLTAVAGSPHFVAPEVLRGSYGPKADIWSCGVVLFHLLSGSYPFGQCATTIHDIVRSVLCERLTFSLTAGSHSVWGHVTPAARAFLRKLLSRDPAKRPTASEALATCPWLSTHPSSRASSRTGTSSSPVIRPRRGPSLERIDSLPTAGDVPMHVPPPPLMLDHRHYVIPVPSDVLHRQSLSVSLSRSGRSYNDSDDEKTSDLDGPGNSSIADAAPPEPSSSPALHVDVYAPPSDAEQNKKVLTWIDVVRSRLHPAYVALITAEEPEDIAPAAHQLYAAVTTLEAFLAGTLETLGRCGSNGTGWVVTRNVPGIGSDGLVLKKGVAPSPRNSGNFAVSRGNSGSSKSGSVQAMPMTAGPGPLGPFVLGVAPSLAESATGASVLRVLETLVDLRGVNLIDAARELAGPRSRVAAWFEALRKDPMQTTGTRAPPPGRAAALARKIIGCPVKGMAPGPFVGAQDKVA